MGLMPEPIEKIIEALSPYLSSKLSSLGYIRNGVEKDDLLQEIRIRIWKAYRSRGDDIQYFNAYIKKIVFSVFINEINRIKKEDKLLEIARTNASQQDGSNEERLASHELLKKTLVASIGNINKSKQQVIKLRLEGYTIDQIARLNNWSYRKTCNMLYRGIRELKHEMRKKGIYYED